MSNNENKLYIHESTLVDDPITRPGVEDKIYDTRQVIIEEIRKTEIGRDSFLQIVGVIEDSFNEIAKKIGEYSFSSKYHEKNIPVYNKDWARYEMKRVLYDIIKQSLQESDVIKNGEKTDAIKQLDRFGRIFLDLNGLKAINDYADHEKGDIFLFKTAQILTESKQLKEFANTHGINYKISAEGGDEYGIWLEKKSGILNDEEMAEMCKIIDNEVAKMDTTDFFSLAGTDIRTNIENAKIVIPDKYNKTKDPADAYVFHPSIASGYITLSEAFNAAAEDEKFDFDLFEPTEEPTENPKKINEKKLILQIYLIMDYCFSMSDGVAKLEKENFKRNLAESKDTEDNFLLFLMQRNKESVEKNKEIISLKHIIEEISKRSAKIEGIAVSFQQLATDAYGLINSGDKEGAKKLMEQIFSKKIPS